MSARPRKSTAQRPPASRTTSNSVLSTPTRQAKSSPRLNDVEVPSDSETVIDLTSPSRDEPVVLGSDDSPKGTGARHVSLKESAGIQNTANSPMQHSAAVPPREAAPFPLPVVPSFANRRELEESSPLRTKRANHHASHENRQSRSQPGAATFPDGKVADFFPWTSNAAEDTLNEHVIRSGYADKPPGSNQSESHTARPSIWPSLKNKSGLPVLSALLVQVMEKRHALSRCTAPSTFKPPPRVTLTDSKREAWLRDLADSEVPLRRLSRTIPHGIRGKTLLDQCLGKKIPVQRAVWLAKCVGANELRAFRRKGVTDSVAWSGEIKWVRDWTILVEQFLDAVVSARDRHDWRSKVDYAIRFVLALHREQLLEKPHYWHWVLLSFQTSPDSSLPIWTQMIQLLWNNLVCQQQRGLHLADALLGHLYILITKGRVETQPQLSEALARMLAQLASEHYGCLAVIPSWTRYRLVLNHLLASDPSKTFASLWKRVVIRNDRLHLPAQSARIRLSHLDARLVDMLSSLAVEVSDDDLKTKCLAITQDQRLLVETLIRWASSKYAFGAHRIYLAARLIRHSRDAFPDLENGILGMLDTMFDDSAFCRERAWEIIAHLVRSGHFSLGRCLQWLITMGGMSAHRKHNAELLLHVPTENLSPQVLNLRHSLLRRFDYKVENQQAALQEAVTAFDRLISSEHTTTNGERLAFVTAALERMTGSTKFAFSAWLRAHYAAAFDHGRQNQTQLASLSTFCSLRAVCEYMEDLELLADLLVNMRSSSDFQILASVADTLNMHYQVFGAMAELEDIFVSLCKRQRALREQRPLNATFLTSLVRLLVRCKPSLAFAKELTSDLAVCEHSDSMSVCSPASDSVVSAKGGSISSDADIDRILASGNTMDEQLMARLFSAIVERSVKQVGNKSDDVTTCGRWFAQLRAFDRAHFGRLLQNLLHKLIGNAGVEQIRVLHIALIGSDCLEVEVALQAWDRRIDNVSSTSAAAAARLALAALEIFVPKTSGIIWQTDPASYRFRLAQNYACTSAPLALLRFASRGLAVTVDPYHLLTSEAFLDLMRRYCVKDADAVWNAVSASAEADGKASMVAPVLKALLGILSLEQSGSTERDVMPIIELVDLHSLPVCKIAIKHAIRTKSSSDLEQTSLAIVEALKRKIQTGDQLWPELLESLPPDTVEQLYAWASGAVLDHVSDFCSSPFTGEAPDEHDMTLLKASIVTATVAKAEVCGQLPNMAEKLQSFVALFETGTSWTTDRVVFGKALEWLSLLLQLIVLSCASTEDETTTLTHRGRLLCACCNLLGFPKLQAQQRFVEYLFDVTSSLAACLNADQLASVARQLLPAVRADSRVAFILGVEETANMLLLASRGTTANASVSPITIQSGFQTPGRASQPQTPTQRTVTQSTVTDSSVGSLTPSQQRPAVSGRPGGASSHDIKYTGFTPRPWEIMTDPTPNMGENDTSLSLSLFAARKVI